jgi:dephospho-CoA kinase
MGITDPGPRSPDLPILRIGLTGGIASGKTTVADLFAQLGVPVIDTDLIAREVVEPGCPALAAVVAAFGSEVLDASGRLDRSRLRDRVFRDDAARSTLESILHPAIRREVEARSATAGGPYQIHVVPLLSEKGLRDTVDRVLVIDCPPSVQLARLMARDRMDRSAAERILAAQATREQRLAIADDTVDNAGDETSLQSVVEQLHRKYVQLAARRTPSTDP